MTESSRLLFERILFVTSTLVLAYLVYLVLVPFLTPLVWAVIFAIVFDSWQQRLRSRTGPTLAALATTLLAAALIITPAVLVLSMLIREMPQVVDRLQQATVKAPAQIERLWEIARHRIPVSLPEDPAQLVGQQMQRGLSLLASGTGSALADLFATLVSLFIFLFSLFFLLRDGHQLVEVLLGVMPFPERESRRLVHETRDLVVASVGAGLAVAAAQGAIGGAAFWLLGIGAPGVWGVVMAISAFVPVVGAALVWVPTAAWLILSGEIGRGITLALVGTLGVSLADNVLRPLLLSDKVSANGLVIFLGLLGGASAFGFVGLVVGPVILITAGSVLRMFQAES